MRRATLIMMATASVLLGIASSASPSALLGSYGVPNSIIGSATYSNLTYSGTRYVLVNVSGKPYFLINASGAGTFVLNASAIAEVLGPTITASLASQIDLSTLGNEMNSYINSSASAVTTCVQETGIDRSTCTLGNYCNSCELVPSCNRALYETGGPTGVVGSGIMLFQAQYAQLQSNESLFYRYANGSMADSNIITRVDGMKTALASISSITSIMGENPIFPPPESADFSACGTQTGSLTSNVAAVNADWYCNALGYCPFTTYNTTLLGQINARMSSIEAQLPTASKIMQISRNITNTENVYIAPILAEQQGAILAKALNTTLAGFNATISDSVALLGHISNATLASEVSSALAGYLNLTHNYAQLNVTEYSNALAAQYQKIKQQYAELNASYSGVVGEAENNTIELIALQLSGDKSNSTSALAFRQQELNAQLASPLTAAGILSIKSDLSAISSKIPALGSQIDLSPQAISRAIDGPFVAFVSGALGMPYPGAVSSAPLLSALLSLIIGAVLFALLCLWRWRLAAKHRLRHHPQVRRAWRMLFAIAAILVLLYIIATYAVAAAANSSAPESAFASALSSSRAVVIAINGTATPGLSNCALDISALAARRGYKPKTIYLSGAACTGAGAVMNTSQCLNQYARLNVPVVMLTQTTGPSSISIYSMYGTMVRAQGNQSFTDSCYVSYFIR